MRKYRICSLLTALCIAVSSTAVVPKKTMAAQTFNTEQIIEAEDGVLNGVLWEKDSSASGKTAVYINTGAVSKSENIDLEAMSWLVNFPKKGNYRVFVRAYFSKDTRDDFWIGTNDDWTKVSAGTDADYKWYEASQIECTAKGVKKLKIQPAETDGRFDAIYITSNSDEKFAPPTPYIEKSEDDAEVVKTDDFVHRQEKVLEIKGTGMQFDAGVGSYTSEFSPVLNRSAANLDVLKAGMSNSVSSLDASESPHLQIEFKTDKTANYSIWVRFYAAGSSSDSIFYSFGKNNYTNKTVSQGTFKWYKLYSGKMQADTVQQFRLRSREVGCLVDNIIITNLSSFVPTGRYGNLPDKLDTTVEKLDGNKYEKPPVYPPANEHPRVLFRKDDIPRIMENMESDQNSTAKADYEDFLSQEVDVDSGSYNVGNMMRIEARAFDYALNGNKENGLLAKDAILGFFENNMLNGQAADAITRNAGHAIYTAAEVYDWCYDLWTPAERTKIISECTALASGMEMGWPPSGQGAQTGHGAEAQLLRDFMALAIAAYDERPDLWNYIAGRYYQEYVPTFNFWPSTMYQGSSYGNYRQMWSTWSYLLLKGMGAEAPVNLEKMADAMLWQIYYRRPDGQLLRDGDIYDDKNNTMWKYWALKQQASVNGMLLTGNKFLKLETAFADEGMVYSSSSNEYGSEILFLIFNDPEIQPAKDYSELPLSKYFESPFGIMVARTGWDNGVESPSVVARMKVGEYQTNNHQHLDAGEFQIYYKGILASDSGVYQGFKPNDKTNGGTTYGSDHMNQYATKTIAHNCMLVYDPSEGSGTTARNDINDGGQHAVNGGGEFGLVSEDSEAHVASVEGYEIDPTNTMAPNYSYLKGNLTKAYTSKVADYKRSFMFLNLKNENVPAAMIVFDKIDSSNETFKKTWLLHSMEEPTIDGNRTVCSRTYHSTLREYGYNGKLTLDTLLPADCSIKKVGGDDGWSNVNGTDYTGYPLNSQTDEGSSWRVEVSPKAATKEDYFLNVMQVSDNDKSEYLPVALVENDLFYGATISDRVVMFSKSGKRVNDGFSLDVDGMGELQYTICDMNAGNYKVTSGGKSQVIAVSEKGGVLAFVANAGKVTVEKTSEKPDELQLQTPEQVKDDDVVSVKLDGVFIYNKVPAVLHNDTVLINADEISKHFGVETETDGESLKLSRKEGNVEFVLGSNIAYVNSEQVEMTSASEQIDGVWLIPARTAAEALGGSISWDRYSRTVFLSLPPEDLSLPAGYVKVVNAEADEGDVDPLYLPPQIVDEDSSTIWSAKGVGRYVTLELEKMSSIISTEIMFNPNSSRNAAFAIEVSADGKNYTRIYEGAGDGSVEPGSWEKFDFDKPYQAKYVRYFGNGSNISDWNAVQEIRFKLK